MFRERVFSYFFLFFLGVFIGYGIFSFPPKLQRKLQRMRYNRLEKFSLNFEKRLRPPSDVKIDILIPTIEKDLPILTHAIAFAKKNILHPIGQIYIVGQKNEKIKKFCEENSCLFVNEDKIFPFTAKDIHYVTRGMINRNGWLFQQLIKLNADKICSSDYILAIDSNTIFLRPQIFLFHTRVIFHCSKILFSSYQKMFHRLLKKKPSCKFSFLSHHMLFQKDKLKKMKKKIEKIHSKPWYDAIISLTDKKEFAGFSEYETYGNFILSHYPQECVLLHSLQRSYSHNRLQDFLSGQIKLPQKTKTIVFQNYK